MSDSVNLVEFRGAYLAEAEELLAIANATILAVEIASRRGERSLKSVRELFRAVHTVKGLSAMVGIEPIVAVAHRIETCLRAADRAGGHLSTRAVDVLFQGIRAIEQRVKMLADGVLITHPSATLLDALDALDLPAEPGPAASSALLDLEPALLAKLGAAEQDQLARGVADGRRALCVEFVPSAAYAERGLNITAVRERVGRIAEIVKVLPRSLPPTAEARGGLVFAMILLSSATDEELIAAAAAESPVHTILAAGAPGEQVEPPQPESPDVDVHQRGVVRVEVGRLDEAMEGLSALIVTRFRLSRALAALADTGAPVRELQQIMVEHARQFRELRAAILRLRMVPVAEVLDCLPLLVRGLKRSTGKQVRLDVTTGGAEVDKAVGERIFPALVHLVRNAIGHGLEPASERTARGKREEGTLTIVCAERANTHLEVVVRDDGGGIDPEAVARKAGRAVPETDAALLELLCLPGLSTRSEADATSGRGMGMDIVRRIIVDQLGGELQLVTAPGVGTTFTLRVPLTISIVDAFTFDAGEQRFAVPISTVEEIVEIDPSRLVRGPSRSHDGGHATMLERRGETLPLLRLDVLFQRPQTGEARKALVVRRNGAPLAFVIDRMIAQQEVVVRPLEDPLVKVPGITGATDLGDGRPTLVLDLSSLSTTLALLEPAA